MLRALGGEGLVAAAPRARSRAAAARRALLDLAGCCSSPRAPPAEAVASRRARGRVADARRPRPRAAARLVAADEFLTTLDRRAARRAAARGRARARAAAARAEGARDEQLVCATVHADVAELRPDWEYNTTTRELTKFEWPDDGDGGDATAAATATTATTAASTATTTVAWSPAPPAATTSALGGAGPRALAA